VCVQCEFVRERVCGCLGVWCVCERERALLVISGSLYLPYDACIAGVGVFMCAACVCVWVCVGGCV